MPDFATTSMRQVICTDCKNWTIVEPYTTLAGVLAGIKPLKDVNFGLMLMTNGSIFLKI